MIPITYPNIEIPIKYYEDKFQITFAKCTISINKAKNNQMFGILYYVCKTVK